MTLDVAAVIEDVPENSHFTFDFLISFITYQPGRGSLADLTSWRWLGFLTYIQLVEDSDAELLESKLSKMFVDNRPPNPNIKASMDLQPLFDIYLQSAGISNPQGGLFKINSYDNIISLGIIAVLIAIIAFINYLNIMTALMRTRIKEIGVRKVFGTSKVKIVLQMMMETAVLVGVSGIISFVTILILYQLDYLTSITIQSLGFSLLTVFSLGLIFCVLTGLLLGGIYSGYSALVLLQNKLNVTVSKFSFKNVVLLAQYTISATLIAVSLIVVAQIEYFSARELGYDRDGIITLPFRGNNVGQDIERLRNELKVNPVVSGVSFGPSLDGSASGSPLRLKEWPENETVQTAYFGVDFEFTRLMDLQLRQGRFFNVSINADSTQSILINETLAQTLDIEDPIGSKVVFAGGNEYEIIGVFNDFNYQSLHHEIGPMALVINFIEPRNMLIRFEAESIGNAITSIENGWHKVFPENEYPFQYKFLDDQLGSLYTTEKVFSEYIQLFTGLAIFVALLGLYGLSSISIHLKIKRISIMRVLGARLIHVGRLVVINFLVI
ncbi:MAG: FtsX-like permease family protein, partial [Bacteroidota bacterium]